MGRSQEFAAVIQEFYLSSKPEKAPSCWDQNWANCTISLSNLVRVFQGLGAVIYSITLPEPWDSVWIVMGPGHRAFFPFDLPLPSGSKMAPSTAVIPVMMLIKEVIKAMLVGRVDTYFLRLLIYLRKLDSFQWCELLFRSGIAAPDFKARCRMSTASQNLSWLVSDRFQNKI